MYIYIYIYTEREGEGERERGREGERGIYCMKKLTGEPNSRVFREETPLVASVSALNF